MNVHSYIDDNEKGKRSQEKKVLFQEIFASPGILRGSPQTGCGCSKD
jgi:hypothetical protein